MLHTLLQTMLYKLLQTMLHTLLQTMLQTLPKILQATLVLIASGLDKFKISNLIKYTKSLKRNHYFRISTNKRK